MYLNCDLYGVNCLTGMSCLLRKSVLADAGGIQYLGQYLSEDFYLAQLFISR